MMELLDWLLTGLIDELILGIEFEFSWHVVAYFHSFSRCKNIDTDADTDTCADAETWMRE